MNELDEYPKELQYTGMDTPDHFIDLSKYELIEDIDEEIKKLQQDIEIRRHARQRMGVTDDDENILILDEKVKILETERQKRQAEAEKLGKRVALVIIFLFIVLPITIFLPPVGAVLITLIIIHIIRNVRRKKRSANNVEESNAEPERALDK